MLPTRLMERPLRRLARAAWLAAAITTVSTSAQAQLEQLDEGLAVGEWVLFPSLELRVRGEYRRHPLDVGGDQYARTGIQADDYRSAAPAVASRATNVNDLWWISERARLGLRVSYDVISAKITLQDARVLSILPGTSADVDGGGLGEFAPYEMYLDIRNEREAPSIEGRLGRQQLQWGDGRLLGNNDWLPRGGALDAARVRVHFGDLELEALAALLALPGSLPPPYVQPGDLPADSATGAETSADGSLGSGAQLYGLRADYKAVSLFNVELAALARIARDPLPRQLMPGDTYTVDARVYGEERGFRYAAEGAVQLGRVAGYGVNRDIFAFAASAYADWQTALPGDFRFRLEGAYASGDDSNGSGDSFHRFDPILPEVHEQHGQMDLYSWSNLIEGAGSITVKPAEPVTARARYAFVALAEPNDRLSTGNLIAVGANPDNQNRILGHEVDAKIDYRPAKSLRFGLGYGLFILGDGGRAILQNAGRGDHDLLHHGYFEAELKVP